MRNVLPRPLPVVAGASRPALTVVAALVRGTGCATLGVSLAVGSVHAQGGSTPRGALPHIPLCAGLTITTAISQANGDYESIKTVRAVTARDVRLTYSSEGMVMEMLDAAPRLQRVNVRRTIARADLDTASLYLQQYSAFTPELVPGTTALGTSSAVLRSLMLRGRADVGIFIPFSGQAVLDRNEHPNVYDNAMVATLHRVAGSPVVVPVIVDDRPVDLPAIRVAGNFFGDSTELFFLDDPANPITLRFRFGIGAITQGDADLSNPLLGKVKAGDDRDVLRVVKISTRCEGGTSASGGASPGTAPPPAGEAGSEELARMEQALLTIGKVEVYQVFFGFNSDTLREESTPTLHTIAAVLARHPDWTLRVDGHTDNIAGDAYNLALSRRRAAAVKRALVTKHAVQDGRLRTDGFGEGRPLDTNDTVEGRARNRRVELVRITP
ncbi:MAG: OmpA family protein [Gemmatimonadetes bacterium]|nr:OmpA family protein [Gemmatimonadota bacterium]